MTPTKALMAGAVALAVAVPQGAAAQELQAVGNRQCAIPGTELHALLAEQLPGCDLYCTVDNELVAGYETYPGLVFACADRRGAIIAQDDDAPGLSGAGIAALAGIGLLLGAVGGGGGRGATVNTNQ